MLQISSISVSESCLQVLQQLPTKSDIIEKVSMAFEQGDLYDNLRNEFNKKLQAEKDGTTVKVMFVLWHEK